MYRVYAARPARRASTSASAAGWRRCSATTGAKIELMNGLLLSLPGTPVIYYGDEIGMGDNVYLGDRNGVRTPMQWTGDRNAGFSRGQPAAALPAADHRPRVPLRDGQRRGPAATTAARCCGGCGGCSPCASATRCSGGATSSSCTPRTARCSPTCAADDERSVLIVANLSRFAQYVELDLSRFRGAEPVELFGQTHFPPIGELPYLLTLGPHAFYWLAIETRRRQPRTPTTWAAP